MLIDTEFFLFVLFGIAIQPGFLLFDFVDPLHMQSGSDGDRSVGFRGDAGIHPN